MNKKNKLKKPVRFSWIRSSISMKVSFSLLIMIVIIFSTTGTVIYSYTKSLLVKNIETELTTKSDAIAAQVNSLFAEKKAVINQFSANQQVTNLLATAKSRNDVQKNPHYDGVMKALEQTVQNDEAVAMAWVASSKANFLIGNDHLLSAPDFDITSRPWYGAALEKDDVYFTEPYMDEVFGKVILSIMKPIKVNDEPAGFVAIDLFLDKLPDIMESYTLGKGGYSFLLSEDGTILYHPNPDLILDEQLQSMSGDLGEIGEKMVKGEKGLSLNLVNNHEEYIGYSPVPTTNWSVATAVPQKEALKNLNSFSLTMLLLFGVGCIILMVLVFILLKHLLKALPEISKRMKLLADGDLSQEILTTKANDEVGQLVVSTNQMNVKLRELLQRISTVSETVSSQSEELTQSANEVKFGSEQISSTMEELSMGSDSQANQTSELSSTMSSFTDKVQNADERGENMKHSSQQVLELTNKGSNLMAMSSGEMVKINQVFRETVEKVGGLNTHSQKISKLVLIIREIAEQTNLLALNAAIEAARAGEHGRGFAVVADEVRNLAEQVADSVTDITEIVQDIQIETGNVTQSLTEGYKEVENGTKQIDMTEQTFTEIQNAVQLMVDDIQGISEILMDITKNAEEMNGNIQNMAAFSEETAAGVEEVSATSQQTTSSMEEVASSSNELAKSAEELNELIHQFRM